MGRDKKPIVFLGNDDLADLDQKNIYYVLAKKRGPIRFWFVSQRESFGSAISRGKKLSASKLWEDYDLYLAMDGASKAIGIFFDNSFTEIDSQ